MARIEWDKPGERRFEAGVDRGVLYTDDGTGVMAGVPWNGLISVDDSSEAATSEFFMDGVKYLDSFVPGDYKATLSAFTYPNEFEPCLGVNSPAGGALVPHQMPKRFGLSYRTRVGNDVAGVDHGYKIHLVYNALVVPANLTHTTLGENVEASDFSWAISATPVVVPGSGIRPTAHFIIDSTRFDETAWGVELEEIEDILWGDDSAEASMPTMAYLLDLFLDLDP